MLGFLVGAVKDLEEREKDLQKDVALITTVIETLKEFFNGNKELDFGGLFGVGFVLGAAAQAQYLLQWQRSLFHKEDILHIKEMDKRIHSVITYQDCEDIIYLNKTFSKKYEIFLNHVAYINENYVFSEREVMDMDTTEQILLAGIEKGAISVIKKVLKSSLKE